MGVKLKLITAVSENMGIGKNGELPWRLSKEMAYFNRITSTTKDPKRRNVVIMGRRTWESIPQKFKPLSNRINFVLTNSDLDFSQYKDVYKYKSLSQAIQNLLTGQGLYGDVWVIGGASVYKEALYSPYFHRLYLTKIQKNFDCDTFFPSLPENLNKISDPNVPEETQEDDGIKYSFHVYEKKV